MKIYMKDWIDVYCNKNYEVNPYTGEVRKKEINKMMSPHIVWTNKKERIIKCIQYGLSEKGKVKEYKAHRLVAEAVLQRDLSEIIIGHKDGNNVNNNFYNLIIGGKKNKSPQSIKVFGYAKDRLYKIFSSLAEFEKETGISRKTLHKHQGVYEVAQYRFEIIDEKYTRRPKYIYMYDEDYNLKGKFKSFKEAEEKTGIKNTEIMNCENGGKPINGLIFIRDF